MKKRYGASFAIVTAAVLLGSLPLPAHNGHDHGQRTANTARDGIALAESGAGQASRSSYFNTSLGEYRWRRGQR